MRYYVPWREIRSWRCLACGMCCSRFNIPLRSYEYAQIFQVFGPQVMSLHHSGNSYLKKVKNKCVFQEDSGECFLQQMGLKPVACKLWPFAVSQRKIKQKDNRRAIFHHQGERYYVYIKPSCPGINQGRPKNLPSILHEIVEISINPTKLQEHSTSQQLKPNSTRLHKIRNLQIT